MLHDENIASKIYLLFAKQLLQPPHSFSPMNERTRKKSIRVCVERINCVFERTQWAVTNDECNTHGSNENIYGFGYLYANAATAKNLYI